MRTKKKPKQNELLFVSEAKTQIKGSVAKINRVLDVIRNQPVLQAAEFLFHSNYGCSKDLAKLLKSASSNAIYQDIIPEEDLKKVFVQKIWANKSIRLRRMKAGPKGRGRPILKHYSHVFVELGILKDKEKETKEQVEIKEEDK